MVRVAALEATAMYDIFYVSTRLARVAASDGADAKRRFAAYALYGDATSVISDVELSFGDDAEATPASDPLPAGASSADLRAWLARNDARAERFEVGLFEDPTRALDAYLRLLATNDPWRLEGHGSIGRALSDIPIRGDLTTFDGRVRYRFDATQFFDYVRLDVVVALDPARPHESVRIESLVDVSALHDDALRQIASSYDTIANEHRLTARYASDAAPQVGRAYDVTFPLDAWRAYVAHRIADPERFVPPVGWTSSYPSYGDG